MLGGTAVTHEPTCSTQQQLSSSKSCVAYHVPCSTKHRAEHVHHDFFDVWSSHVRDLKEFGVGTSRLSHQPQEQLCTPCPQQLCRSAHSSCGTSSSVTYAASTVGACSSQCGQL
jgi:hypothetical protein